ETLFRYGRPQAGRLREFRTFGIEVIGAAEPEADVEVIAVGQTLLRSIERNRATGLADVRLEINSIGDQVCRPAYRDELIAYLEEHREQLRDEHRDGFRTNPLRVLDCKEPSCRAVAADAPKIVDRLCGPCK